MIKSLRRRFVLIAMGSFTLVVLAVIIVINVLMTNQINTRVNGVLNMLSENEGMFPELEPGSKGNPPEQPPRGAGWGGFQMTEETPFETRYFSVQADGGGRILRADTRSIAAVSEDKAKELAREVLDAGRREGYAGTYKYLVTEKDYGKLVVFLDCASDIATRRYVMRISAIVAALSFIAVLALVTLLTGIAIKPVAQSMEKQKQFITDAGHEIKTPLAIISANADVLELSEGANEWTQSIKNQAGRLNRLVQELLTLSKMEEGVKALDIRELDFSALVLSAAEPFSLLAETQGKSLGLEIRSGFKIKGDGASLHELVEILVDNAVKYSPGGGDIRVRLDARDRHVRLTVSNTVEKLPGASLDRLFDRFYRADASRSRDTGGNGVGLSIARAIAEAHKAKIYCAADGEHRISFILEL